MMRRHLAVVGVLATIGAPCATPAAAQDIRQILQLLDGGRETLYLRIRQGTWSYQSPRVPTAAWKFSGHIRINTPREGKWRIRLVDLVRPPEKGYEPILDEIVEANEVVPFSYRTGGTAQLQAQLFWSRRDDAIASVEIEWDGCLCALGDRRHGEQSLPGGRRSAISGH